MECPCVHVGGLPLTLAVTVQLQSSWMWSTCHLLQRWVPWLVVKAVPTCHASDAAAGQTDVALPWCLLGGFLPLVQQHHITRRNTKPSRFLRAELLPDRCYLARIYAVDIPV